MDIVLGVSMTPTAVRMALVEGQNADGVTLDQESFDMAVDRSLAISGAAEQVVAAILGTRESAAEGGHHLVSTGVAWTDHAAAAEVRDALRAQRIEDVILVSELHAAGALAQAIGQAVGCERTALLFLERDTATLAVVRTADGAVVRVSSRTLHTADAVAELQDMVAGLEAGDDPAQTLFMVGSGVDIAALKPEIAARTSLPVHAPEDGEMALARGAALASVNTPRYEASTVSLASTEDTSAGATQMAAAGYMAPLGYSAVPDDDANCVAADYVGLEPAPENGAESRPFLLVGSALSTIFVVGVVALVISLAVAIRPTAEQRPDPSGSAVVSSSQPPPPAQARDAATPAPLETIQAPIPIVQEAPRTVFVTPDAAGPAPVAPPPAPAAAAEPAPAPAPEPAPPPAPAPTPSAAGPAPAAPFIPPIVVPVPIVIPPIFRAPVRSTPVPRYPSTTPTYPTTTYPTYPSSPTRTTESSTPAPTTSYPTYTPPVTTLAPSSGSGAGSGSGSSGESDRDGSEGSSGSSGSGSSAGGSQTIWPPLWPFGR